MSKSSNPGEYVPQPPRAPVDEVLSRAQAATGMTVCLLGAFWVLTYPFL